MIPLVIKQVVENELCIGCGMCVAFCPSEALKMKWDENGLLIPILDGECCGQGQCVLVCPFNPFPIEELKTEDEISQLFIKEYSFMNKIIGKYNDLYVGFSNNFREYGSSGGIATWLLTKLLKEKHVDYVVALRSTQNSENHFEYTIVENPEEIISLSKTKYYPISIDYVIEKIRNIQGIVAITALPCFTKAIRLSQYYDSALKSKIKFIIGTLCGGLKGRFFTEYLASKRGIKHNEIIMPNYRIKDYESKAYDYSFGCLQKGSKISISYKMREVGDMWGTGLFKPTACEFCDDLSAELADISLGDAWIPPYNNDGKGNNIIISRNVFLSELLKEGFVHNELVLEKISLKMVIHSQQANVNHRRKGLRYRLYWESKKKVIPPKRVIKGLPLNILKREIQIQRMKVRKLSFDLWKQKKEYDIFVKHIKPHLEKLERYTTLSHLFRWNYYYYKILYIKGAIKRFIYSIRNILTLFSYESRWLFVITYINFFLKKRFSKPRGGILLIPAANLDGGFGDDVMVSAFVSQTKPNEYIDILTERIIRRDDYLGKYKNVSYLSGFTPGNYFYLLNLVKNYSTVVVLGADVLDGFQSFHNSIDRLRLIYLSSKFNSVCKIIGFSINKSVLPRIQKMFNKISNRCDMYVRDIDSYNRFNSILFNGNNIHQAADIAFLTEIDQVYYTTDEYNMYHTWVNECKNKGMKIAAVCPNAYLAGKNGLSNQLELFDILVQAIESTGISVAYSFLYHDLRPHCKGKNDKDISEILYNKYRNNLNCYFTPNIRNGCELKSYLRNVDFIISGRMHFGIAGFVYGKPMFGIEYQDKFSGLFKMMGLDSKKCSIDYFNPQNSDNIIKEFIQNLNWITEIVNNTISNVIFFSKNNFV